MLLTSDLSGPSETQGMLQIPLVVIDWVYARIALSVAQASGLELDGYLSIYYCCTYGTERQTLKPHLIFSSLLGARGRSFSRSPAPSTTDILGMVYFAFFAFCGAFVVFVVASGLARLALTLFSHPYKMAFDTDLAE